MEATTMASSSSSSSGTFVVVPSLSRPFFLHEQARILAPAKSQANLFGSGWLPVAAHKKPTTGFLESIISRRVIKIILYDKFVETRAAPIYLLV